MFRIEKLGMDRRQTRDAIRLTLQSVVAVVASYQLFNWWGINEQFVGVLSAVLIIQPTVSSAIGEAWNRLLSTVLGCLLGISGFLLMPDHYGRAVTLALSVFAVSLVAGWRAEWRYGLVAAIALSLGSESNAWQTAIDRSFAIGLGLVIGLVVSLVVWPDTAGARARRHIASALRAIAERLEFLFTDATESLSDDQKRDKKTELQKHYHRNYRAARDAVKAIRFSNSEMLMRQVEQTERLYNSVLILSRAMEETGKIADDEDFASHVKHMHSTARDIVISLGEGETSHETAMAGYGDRLESLREKAAGSANSPRDHVIQNAFVFGLGEVQDSLNGLIGALADSASTTK